MGIKIPPLQRAVKLLSLLVFAPNFTKNDCFCEVGVQVKCN
nr:MAG TPA: hypothetical protein [Caudoviricetes sp.]